MKLEEHKSTIHMLLYHVASGECEGEDEDSAHDLNNELFDIWDNDAPMLREMNEDEIKYIKSVAYLSMDDFVPLFADRIEELLQAIHDIND